MCWADKSDKSDLSTSTQICSQEFTCAKRCEVTQESLVGPSGDRPSPPSHLPISHSALWRKKQNLGQVHFQMNAALYLKTKEQQVLYHMGEGQAGQGLWWAVVGAQCEPKAEAGGGEAWWAPAGAAAMWVPPQGRPVPVLLSLRGLSAERALSSGWPSQGRMKAMSGASMK